MNLIYHSGAVINGIFKPNTVTVQSLSILFIFSQMAISLMPACIQAFNKVWVYLLIKKREECKRVQLMFEMVEVGPLLLCL